MLFYCVWHRKTLVPVLCHLIWFLFNISGDMKKMLMFGFIALMINFWITIASKRVHYHQLWQFSILNALLSLLARPSTASFFPCNVAKKFQVIFVWVFVPMYVNLKTSIAAWTGMQLYHSKDVNGFNAWIAIELAV